MILCFFGVNRTYNGAIPTNINGINRTSFRKLLISDGIRLSRLIQKKKVTGSTDSKKKGESFDSFMNLDESFDSFMNLDESFDSFMNPDE